MMPEFKSEEEKIAFSLKNACKQVQASPAYKDKLLSRLMQEGRAIKASKPRKLWNTPLFWGPAAALVVAVVALVIVYFGTGLPGRPPAVVAPPPETSPAPTTTAPDTPTIGPSPSTVGPSPSTTGPTTSPVLPVTPPASSSPASTDTPPVTPTIVPEPPPSSTVPLPLPVPPVPPSTSVPPIMVNAGILRIMVTDAPPQLDVSEINVLLSNVQVNKSEDIIDESGWVTVNEETSHFDLIKLRNGSVADLLGEATLEIGLYSQIRMDVEVADAVIDGERVQMGVTLPSGKLKLASSFEIREGQTTIVTIDFDAAESLVFQGNGGVNFKPVVRLTVEYL